jgi:hypothetical protein
MAEKPKPEGTINGISNDTLGEKAPSATINEDVLKVNPGTGEQETPGVTSGTGGYPNYTFLKVYCSFFCDNPVFL